MTQNPESPGKTTEPRRWLTAFRDLPKNSTPKIFGVALAVSLAGGILVSASAILLKPLQTANIEREQQQNLMDILERSPGVQELFTSLEARDVEAQVVELKSGRYIRTINPSTFDQRVAARDLRTSIAIPPEHDAARIKRRAKHAVVYILRQNGNVRFVILPIHGKGYASTIYGYIGLKADGNTVIGMNFFEHSETPGLGARITDTQWLEQWRGKKIRDAEGALRIGVARGVVAADSPAFAYEVDGLSGATSTSRGVHNLVRFWLGDYGFGPYLQNVQTHTP